MLGKGLVFCFCSRVREKISSRSLLEFLSPFSDDHPSLVSCLWLFPSLHAEGFPWRWVRVRRMFPCIRCKNLPNGLLHGGDCWIWPVCGGGCLSSLPLSGRSAGTIVISSLTGASCNAFRLSLICFFLRLTSNTWASTSSPSLTTSPGCADVSVSHFADVNQAWAFSANFNKSAKFLQLYHFPFTTISGLMSFQSRSSGLIMVNSTRPSRIRFTQTSTSWSICKTSSSRLIG